MLAKISCWTMVSIVAVSLISPVAHAGDEVEIEVPGYGKIKIRKKEKELLPDYPEPAEQPDMKVNCDDEDDKNDRWYWDTNGDGIYDWVWDPYRRKMWWLKPVPVEHGPLAMLLPTAEPNFVELREFGECPMMAVVPEPPLVATSGFISSTGVPLVDGADLYALYDISEVPQGEEWAEFTTDVNFDLANLTVRGWMPWNPQWSTAYPAYEGMALVAEHVPSSEGSDFVALNYEGDIFAMAGWAFDSGMAEFRLTDDKLGTFTIRIDSARRVTLNGVYVGVAATSQH